MKTINTLLFIALTFMTILEGYGQQDAQYTQYMYNMNIINPAYAGSRETLSLGLLGRTQWVGVKGAPETITASIHAPVGKRIGVGFSAQAEKIGPAKETNIYADFAYTLPLGGDLKLAFGLKSGVSLLDVRQLRFKEDDPNNIPINKTFFNVGLGTFFYSKNYYVGLSVPNIIENRYLERKEGQVRTAGENSHYFLTGGYVFELSEQWKLKPSTLVRAVEGAPLSADFSMNALFNDKIEFGASYRLEESVSALVGFNFGTGLRIGYAYDYVTNNLGEFTSGSHEVFILYDLIVKGSNVKSPRFF